MVFPALTRLIVTCMVNLASYQGPARLLAKDQFVDSLPDEDMRLRIRQSRPSRLGSCQSQNLQVSAAGSLPIWLLSQLWTAVG